MINVKITDPITGKTWQNTITVEQYKNSVLYVNTNLKNILGNYSVNINLQVANFSIFLGLILKPLQVLEINSIYSTINQKLVFMNYMAQAYFTLAKEITTCNNCPKKINNFLIIQTFFRCKR